VDRLRLAWAILIAGLIVGAIGVCLLAGVAWCLVAVAAELIALGVLIANLGDES
jgi:hypothetical protein